MLAYQRAHFSEGTKHFTLSPFTNIDTFPTRLWELWHLPHLLEKLQKWGGGA